MTADKIRVAAGSEIRGSVTTWPTATGAGANTRAIPGEESR